MRNAYSTDLRERVVGYVARGGKKAVACRLFQVGHDTVYRWMRQYRATGHVAPKARGKAAVRKINEAVLVVHIQAHPDATLAEIAHVFAVSSGAIWKACQRLGITRKKTTLYAERSLDERRRFQDELAALNPKALVYVDESGVEEP